MKRSKDNVPASLKNINLERVLRKRGIYFQKRVNLELKEAAIPIARTILNKKNKVAPQEPQRALNFSNDVVQAYWEKQVHIIEVLEKRFMNKVEQFVAKMVDGFLQTLDTEVKTIRQTKVKDFFSDNEDELLTQAQLDFTPLLIDQAVLAGQEAYKLLGINDVYTPYKLRDTIAANVRKFTESMLQTDRDTLTNIIQHGIEQGQTMAEIRNTIQLDFQDISKNQAQRITFTEVARASNQASIDAYEQSGVVEGKQWITFGSVDECADFDGQIVYGLSKGFYSGTDDFKDGDPPLHPNCKCIVIPVLEETKAYVPQINTELRDRIKELEQQVDKRTKAYKQLKKQASDDKAYITSLEKYLGVNDEE